MAVSEIHTARSTVNRLIAYIMKDKTEIVESEKEMSGFRSALRNIRRRQISSDPGLLRLMLN